MKLTKIVIGIVLFTSVTACNLLDPLGIFKHDDDDFKIRLGKFESACTTGKSDVSLTPGTQVQNQSVDINRKFQRVVTRGCNGEVTSDRVETLDEPDQHITIKPVTDIKAGTYEATARNRATCASETKGFPSGSAGARTPEFRIHVNTSPALFHFHIMKDQENFIDYEFSSCSDYTKNTCVNRVSLEKGTVILKVNYIEETLATREAVDCPGPKVP